MRKFKFKLESVLKHRAVLEDQALQAFAAAQSEMAACVARISALEMQFQQVVSSRPGVFSTGELEQISLRERHLDAIRSQIEEQERTREGLEARLDDARGQLVVSRRNREAVEHLREIDLVEHRKAAEIEEQAAIDEMAMMRFER